jgi:flagella basal body P-ring formation protein FlgA
VQVSAPAVRTRKPVARGERLDGDALAVVATDLNGQSLRPLLSLDDARGARATHDLAEGALVTRSDIVPEPLVKAGDVVRARVHVGDVELAGSGVAAESGLKDEVIRVINQESRHAFRARVVGSGEVEVVDVR